MDKPTSFVKLSPPILAKMPKEVSKISKFFKKNNQLTKTKNMRKSYMQASFPTTSMREILKIKETFSNF